MSLLTKRLLCLSGLALLFVLAVGVLIGFLIEAPVRSEFDFLYADFTLDACLINRAGAIADAAARDLQFCWDQLRMQGALNDFLIRRVNFQYQHLANQVILWVVVVLTLSGVVLAGFQIVAATRLGQDAPADAPSSELLVERDRIFMRSSVTGLFILVVSFAFFFTYILNVYKITELGDAPGAEHTPPAASLPPPPKDLQKLGGGGGLGPPPD
ncbi:MAG: hypothetical protein KDA50_00860 [Rhodobacteraceae bacterium]|nr:hypothetical protein [Paracoccaceae bacterium]